MLQPSSFLRVAGACLLTGCTLLAQVQTSSAPPKPLSTKPAPAKIKLTTEQQRGLRLLKQAEAQAGSLQPDMRAYVLWRISDGYSKVDRAKSDRVLNQAFVATQSIEQGPEEEDACQTTPTCRTKSWLQTSLLRAIMMRNSDQVLQLLPGTDPVPRKQATAALASFFTERKDFTRALSLLTQVADSDQYPFHTAGDIFLALPKESPDRMTLFSQAQENFVQFQSAQGFGYGDFPPMLLRIWRQLPPPTVLSAVDDILEDGKDSAEKSESLHISFTTDNGSVSFNSAYQLHLFEMLPILDELDHDRAQSLLRENNEAQSMLMQFPHGMQSLDPASYPDHPTGASKNHIRSIRYSLGAPTPGQALAEGAEDQIDRQLSTIDSEAATNPKQALADAMGLPASNPVGPAPFSSPRVVVLMHIAKSTVDKNPTIAKSALDELRKNVDSLQPFQRGRNLSESVRLYLKLGEIDSAKKCLEQLQKAADQTYKEDTDATDPNQAFKAEWPSTALWLETVKLTARISPEQAEQTATEITDLEIADAVRVSYANALIGASESGSDIAQWHKNGQSFTRFDQP
jgi:hypothetical protein